ncbi:MAG: hypothetical protein IJ669_07760 [Prevotella sp.]|nr:hypothetical protein [Prevotella sp.]
MKRIYLFIATALLVCGSVSAQDDNKVTVSGSIQSDVLIPQDDKKIGTEETSHWGLTNSYADVQIGSKYLDAGARVEFLRFPLPGFEKDFKGWGLANIYAKFHTEEFDLTVGNFYDQFGSGFIFRTYEERALGIDNSLLGARLAVRPVKGVQIKGLAGQQRRYWAHNDSWVSGADMELSLDEWFKGLSNNNTYITLGGSFVNKHESDEDIMADPLHKLNLPHNVNAWDARVRLQKGGLNVLAEYAQKTQDPSYDNGYIYRRGNVAMLSASYSQRGMSLLLQAKRSDNMSFRSRRTMTGTSSFINHLPAFTLDHTYALAALYPYATNPNGEWAYQAEFGYLFKKNTFLGGKYGASVKINFSHVEGIDKNPKTLNGLSRGSEGYGSSFWKWGDDGMYYQDINIQIAKRVTKTFSFNFMYMNQFYNKAVVEGHGDKIRSNIFVLDAKNKFNNKTTLRGELQYLQTSQDEGNWMFGLLELSLVPHWMFTVSDMYNCGKTDIHYYQGLVTFNTGSHRLAVGYGRTRAGFNCSGGVCRYVPAQKGVTVSYNYNF